MQCIYHMGESLTWDNKVYVCNLATIFVSGTYMVMTGEVNYAIRCALAYICINAASIYSNIMRVA